MHDQISFERIRLKSLKNPEFNRQISAKNKIQISAFLSGCRSLFRRILSK